MKPFYESDLEEAVMEYLRELGYETLFGPDILPLNSSGENEDANCERKDASQVLLKKRLHSALSRINKGVSHNLINEAIRKLEVDKHPDLISNNRDFHRMVTDGIDIESRRSDGSVKTEKIWLFDLNNIKNNDFLAVNQFTVIERDRDRRPDIVIFINGIPVGVMELKNPADENATISHAFRQIQTYLKEIPSLFKYNEFVIISDGTVARNGTITTPEEWFMNWRSTDGKEIVPLSIPQISTLVKGMLDPKVMLDLIRHFIIFQDVDGTDRKIIAAYHQYYAVNKALQSTDSAISEKGDRRIGVVWHTQGSGKSLSMVFYTGKMVLRYDNPTVVIVTDRNDLDNQLFSTFARSKNILRQDPQQADSRKDLREKLSVESGGIVFTTLQKFTPGEDEDFIPVLTDRKNVIVIADEAHRSQYGFRAKIKRHKESSLIKYGYAKHLRDALPNASFIGFTGTPIEKEDRNTVNVFGDYIDIYDITRSVEDENTVKIYYENRIINLEMRETIEQLLDEEFQTITEEQDESTREKYKSKWSQVEKVIGATSRLEKLANDLVKHFELREETLFGKGIIVTMSRAIAVGLYDEIVKIRPDWHSDDEKDGKIKIVMTGSASDPAGWQKHVRNKSKRDFIAKRFKDENDSMRLVIVCHMWLTGFDVPCLHTMYIDKPMNGHNLMQAIARVNRIFKDKPGGLVVDYIGIASSLKNALSQYTDRDKGNAGIDINEAVAIMLEKYEIIRDMLHKFEYSAFFSASPIERLECITRCMDFVLSFNEDQEKEFIKTVTELEKAHALCVTSDEAKIINIEVGYFKAVKASVMKLKQDESQFRTKKTPADIDAALKQLVSGSIISKEVIDVFETLNIAKPEISILSDEFLQEVKGIKQKNVAIELLRRLLEDKIKAMAKKNLVKSRIFSEMLKQAIARYKNKAIDNARVIDELVKMAKNIKKEQERGKELGLSDDEKAFYDALCVNDAAVKIIGDDILKKIAHDLAEAIRKNLTIDWNLRESVQAKMRTIVKRLLRKYGYPPDHQKLAVKTVMEQAELLCSNEEVYKDIMSEKREPQITILSDIPNEKKFVNSLPVYSLKVAAGKFGNGEVIKEEGWVQVEDNSKKLNSKMFVCQIKGNSMRNVIKNSEYAVFERKDFFAGQGEIVLVQHRNIEDSETGGAYSVKRYFKNGDKIIFKADTDEPHIAKATTFEITPENASSVKVIAEFVGKYS